MIRLIYSFQQIQIKDTAEYNKRRLANRIRRGVNL